MKRLEARPITELSLFSGYGGFTLGLKLAIPNIRTVGYVEWEKYPQKIIAARIKDGFLDEAPIFGDIRAFIGEGYAESYQGMVDVLTAGFPCQPFSVAGKQKGADDSRNMWPATIETIRLVRPRYILLENVPALLTNEYIRQVYGDLAAAEYNIVGDCISAADCGANHKRERLWIMGYSPSMSKGEAKQRENAKTTKRKQTLVPKRSNKCDRTGFAKRTNLADPIRTDGGGGAVAGDIKNGIWGESEKRGKGLQSKNRQACTNNIKPCSEALADPTPVYAQRQPHRQEQGKSGGESWWEAEPPLGRVVDGCPDRVGQLKALGNGIVPAVVAEFLRRIAEEH